MDGTLCGFEVCRPVNLVLADDLPETTFRQRWVHKYLLSFDILRLVIVDLTAHSLLGHVDDAGVFLRFIIVVSGLGGDFH